MHGRISPIRGCNPCGYTMKMSSRYHKLLIYDVKLTTKIDGLGPFNLDMLALIYVTGAVSLDCFCCWLYKIRPEHVCPWHT